MQNAPATQAPVLKRATFTVDLTPEQVQTAGFWLQQIRDSVDELPISGISFDYKKTIEFDASPEDGMTPEAAAKAFTDRIFLAVNDEVPRAAIAIARQSGTNIYDWERNHLREHRSDGYSYFNARTDQIAFAKVEYGEILEIEVSEAPAESPSPYGG